MRIANIFEEGKLGGPQIYIMRLASSLPGQVEMKLIIPTENSETFRAQCEAQDLPYSTLHISRITKEWKIAVRYFLCFPIEIVRLAKEFRKGNFDLVYVCGGSWQYKGAIAGKIAGIRVLWHLNDTSMPWVFRKVFSCLSGLADGYVYASERSKDYYGSLVNRGKPEFVIPAPVDTAQFDPEGGYPGDEDFIERWDGKFVIGTVANINPIKDLETFIRAAAIMNKQIDQTYFVVVGPVFKNQQGYFGSLQRLCKDLSVNNIEFIGSRSDVRPLLQRFDAYVCSSRAESSPIAVWEAMSMGKPVVSTDVGDVPLYIRDDYNGFIVEVGNSQALADRLEQLATDTGMCREFGQRARDVAVRKLDLAQCAERHLKAYLAMVGTL